MEPKFSLSASEMPSNSPNPGMSNVRMNLEEEFSEEDQKQGDNMSVYARIRPMLQREEDAGYKECIAAIDDETVRAVFPKSSVKVKNHNGSEIIEDFKYTRAFGPETGQFLFFEETIMKTMESFIDGQNCLIFSYGITNSGKTYTLQGTEENPGIIILALRLFFSAIEHQLMDKLYFKPEKFADVTGLSEEDILKEISMKTALMKFYNQEVGNKSAEASTSMTKSFAMKLCDCFSDNFKVSEVETTLPPEEMEAAQSAMVMKMLSKQTADKQSGTCNIWVSFIEIYNEYIYDLLQPNVFPRKKLQLAEDQSGDVYVKGAREVFVSNVDEALKLLHIGRKSLRIACTKLNYQSSRSHCIFILKVVRVHEDTYRINRLSFCDLAGSERASKSQTSGMRLKEACYINTSLLVLGRCLEQLRLNQNLKDKKMIPFRESKLTRLFSGHFMGKGNAVMIANASPCEYTFDETLNVLKFSAVAKELMLNDTYMKNASSSLQSISSQWLQSKAQASFSLDQSSDFENSMMEDIQAKDEMIEKLLDLADSLRSNLEQEKKEKTDLEYTIRQEVYRDYSSYSDELLERQRGMYEGQIEDLREHYNQRLKDLEKRKDDIIKELREQIADYEASEDESFRSIDASLSSSFKYCKKGTPLKTEVSFKDDIRNDSVFNGGEIPVHADGLSKELEQYKEENRILKLDLCSIKNQLEISSLELQKSSAEVSRLQNEITEFRNKALLENVSDFKCDHLPEIERLTADLISLKEDLNLVTAERDSTKEELEQVSLLLQESDTSNAAAKEKCLDLSSKLQESLNALEQFEKEVAVLKSEISAAEGKITELTDEKQKMKDTIFSMSEELASSSELIEKLKSEKLDLEGRLATSEESLSAACEKTSSLEKQLEETTDVLNGKNSNILALETACENYKNESSSFATKCKSLEEEISASHELIEKLKREKLEIMNSLGSSEEILKEANEKQSDVNQKLDEANQLLQEQTAKIFALESESEAYKTESSNLFAKCKSFEEEISSISQELEKLKSEKEADEKMSNALINSMKSDLSGNEKQLLEIKRKLEDAENAVESKESEFSQLKKEYTSVQEKLTVMESEFASLESVHGEKCVSELAGLKQKLSDAHKLLEEQDSLCSALKSDNAKLLEDKEQLKTEETTKREASFESEVELSFGEEDNNELDNYKTRLSEKERECDDINNKYNMILQKNHEMNEEITALTVKLEAAANDLQQLEKEKIAAEETMKADFENVSANISQKETELENLQKDLEQCKEFISKLEEEKKALEKETENLFSQLDAAKTELLDMKQKHSDAISSLQLSDSTLKSVQKELEESDKEKRLIEQNYSALLAKGESDEVASFNLKIEEASSKVTQLQDQNSSLIAELASREEQAVQLNKTIESLEEKISYLLEQSALAKEELAQLQKENLGEKNLEIEAVSSLQEKNTVIENLQNECIRHKEEISEIEKKNDELEDHISELSAKLVSTNMKEKEIEFENLKKEHAQCKEFISKLEEEKKSLEKETESLFSQLDTAKAELLDMKQKHSDAISSLQFSDSTLKSVQKELEEFDKEKRLMEQNYSALVKELKLKLSSMQNDLETAEREKRTLEEQSAALQERNDLAHEEMNNLKIENDEKEKILKDNEKLIRVLELNELKASEKIKSLEETLSEQSKHVADMDRQIREKELAISELEKAVDETQKRVKEINVENLKLEKALKKTSANKTKKESNDKENSDLFESSNINKVDKVDSFKDRQLKRNSSTTSEEADKEKAPKKTRRALRARQADSTTVTTYESDEDVKPRVSSRKRKSEEEFLPSKKASKEVAKVRKIPSRRVLKDKKEENLKQKAQNENMSPVQKVAAFVGSTLRSVANTVTSIPSPRMTRGRKKLFNVDAGTPAKSSWKY